MTTPRLAIVHVRESRPAAPRYQRLVDELNAAALDTVSLLGWEIELVGAGDAGTTATLAAARRSDAVLLMGGEDVHPAFYDGPGDYPLAGAHDRIADEAQIALVLDAVEAGRPLLGICRGHQVINVALGGDLVQHLPTTDGHRVSSPGAPDTFLRHRVRLASPAVLDGAVIVDEPVHSSHHQAVGRLGEGLDAVAFADDGVIEAVVHRRAPVTGVQWHPEHRGAPDGQLIRLLRRLEAQAA